ncbi:AMP-binding protein, partial [Flavobacterium sp. ZT3R18]|uniref:non-ribosomal peptide synthetase n=1 Tax=Flavobacterium sp. ZT3R18 TaxID=2594429 RepID=UPI00117A0F59
MLQIKNFLIDLKRNSIDVMLNDDSDLEVYYDTEDLDPIFQEQLKENKQKIIQFLKNEGLKSNPHFSIAAAPAASDYPLSSGQYRLWILSQFEDGNSAYNISATYKVEGKLDLFLLEETFNYLIGRHESLRTVFKINEQGDVRQVILNTQEVNFKLNYVNLSLVEDQNIINQCIKEEQQKTFDLANDILIRVNLIQVSEEQYIITLVLHHIIHDGWSMEVMMDELFSLYETNKRGLSSPLQSLRIQFKDYAVWQQENLKGEVFNKNRSYWLDQFKGVLPVLDIPKDKSRPITKSYSGGSYSKFINPSLVKQFKKLVQHQDTTLFMGLLSIVNTLLYRYSNQSDIIIGTPVAGREHFDLESQIGVYVNTLALRSQFNENESFLNLLEITKKNILEAYNHQMYPFDELVKDLNLTRDMSRNPLFDVMVVLDNKKNSAESGTDFYNDLKISRYNEGNHAVSKFDLTFSFSELEDGLDLSMHYSTDLYNSLTISRFVKHLERLIEAVVSDSHIALKKLNFLTEFERNQLLIDFNDTEVNYPRDKTIIDLFEEQVKKTPANGAIVFNDIEWNYDELNGKVNQFASYLRQNYKIQPNDLIGIKLDRSERMILAILAVLKSGAAYVPINTDYPQERISYLEKDSRSKLIIDEKELAEFYKVQTNYSTDNILKINSPNDLSYVIYTSGSTGNPKGVMIEHTSIVNFIISESREFSIIETDNILQFANISFDTSVEQIFLAFTNGAKLFIITEDIVLDSNKLEDFLIKADITHFHAVPSVIERISEKKKYPSLKRVLTGGDMCSVGLADKWRNVCEFYHKYGPTEATVASTILLYDERKYFSIGKPVANTQIYIL